jgi:hypothetical protein
VLENQVEPTSGAADWLTRLIEHLRPEVAAASHDAFPSTQLTVELASVALGHLATNQDHIVALRDGLAKALPLEVISLAGDYSPSRASGMLVPVPRTGAAMLSSQDEQTKQDLKDMLKHLHADQVSVHASCKDQLQIVNQLRDEVAKVTPINFSNPLD